VRKAFLLTTVLIASIAGFFFWQHSKKSSVDVWNLISPKALFVFEFHSPDDFIKKAKNTPSILIPWSFDQRRMVEKISVISKQKMMLVGYKTTSPSLSYAFITSCTNREKFDSTHLKSNSTQRFFNGHEIVDVKPNTNEFFSYSFIDDYLIVGPPFLIEDIIRTGTANERESFKAVNNELFQLASLKSDDGNLYINTSSLNQLRKISGEKDIKEVHAAASIFDFKVNQNQILLNGFTIDTTNRPSFLSLFKDQTPQPFLMKEILSIHFSSVSHYSISDFNSWATKQSKYLNLNSAKLGNELATFNKKFDWEEFKRQISGEMAVCNMANGNSETPIFLLRVKSDKVLKSLSKILDEQYLENYAGYELRKLKEATFAKNFWPISPDEDLSYYTTKHDYLILANSSDVLKYFIDEIENDNTLGQSIAWNKFLSTTLQESTINYFANGNGIKNSLISYNLNPEQFDFLSMDKVAIQFSGLDHNFYSSAIFQFHQTDSVRVKLAQVPALPFENSLFNPHLVVNHSNRTSEIVVQDSLNEFYLVSDNKITWKQKIDRIREDIHQIDYFNNRKLQYQFVTKDQLHLIDRLGRNVNGFPKTYSSSDFTFSRIVDYNQTKDYRF
jgi:hypothetical protein